MITIEYCLHIISRPVQWIGFLLLFASAWGRLDAQNIDDWQFLNGPPDQNVRVVSVAADTVLVTDQYGRLWTTSDKGEEWYVTSEHIKRANVTSGGNIIIISNTPVDNYVNSVKISSDLGRNWTQVFAEQGFYIENILPVKDVLYLIGLESGASVARTLRSTDDGVTWEDVDPMTGGGAFTSGCPSDRNLYRFDGSRLYRLRADEKEWEDMQTVPDNTYKLTFINGSSCGLYAFVTGGDVYESTDGGGTFTLTDLQVPSYLTEVTSAGDLYFRLPTTPPYQILRTPIDGGETVTIDFPLADSVVASLQIIDRDHLIINYLELGAYYSDDGGETWKNMAIPGADVRLLDEDNAGQLLASTPIESFLTTDDGLAWRKLNVPGVKKLLDYRHAGHQHPITGTLQQTGRIFISTLGLYGSDDNGETWTEYIAPIRPDDAGVVYRTGNGTILYFAHFRYRSTDNGETWEEYENGASWVSGSIIAEREGVLYTTGTNGWDNALFLSTDDGVSWQLVPFPSSFSPLEVVQSAVVTADGSLLIGKWESSFWKKSGGEWEEISGPAACEEQADEALLFTDRIGFLYVSTPCGVYRSVDNGGSWHLFAVEPDDKFVRRQHIARSGSVFGATGTGLYKAQAPLSVPGDGNPGSGPALVHLPNPLIDKGKILFSLAERSHVSIDLYDVQGRLIETVVQGEYPEGDHGVMWDAAAAIPSGAYMLVLNAGEKKTAVRLMITE